MRKLVYLVPLSACLAAVLTGCGVDSMGVSVPTPAHITVQGMVHGGNQPVSGATIQLYTVGATGNGSAATPMIASPPLTQSDGSFALSSGTGGSATYDYTCTNPTDQVYITATGGNPGLSPSTVYNNSLVLMTALGDCGNLNYSTYISINEVTTAAAAWALAPFMTSYANVGASSTNATDTPGANDSNGLPTNSRGLPFAMLDAQLLASSTTGLPATLPSGLTVEPGKLFGLADAIATCVNSDGTSACTPLFTAAKPTHGSMPADTLTALLDIVKNPGQNPGGVFNVIGGTPPYPTVLSQAPNDWTITLSVTGGGISYPGGIDIDRAGNVWVAGQPGELSEFSAQGEAISPNTTTNSTTHVTTSGGYGVGDLQESYGLTIDTKGNIWVTNQQSGCNGTGSVSKFLNTGTVVLDAAAPICGSGHPPYFYDSSTSFPDALSAAPNGDILIGNFGGNGATAYTDAGAVVSPTCLGSAQSNSITAVAADSSNGVWIANSEIATVTHVTAAGTVLSDLACCNGANGIATDSSHNAWISNYYGDSFSVVSSSNTSSPGDAIVINGDPLLGTNPSTSSTYTSGPAGVAVDAGQNVWVANYRGQSISNLAGIDSSSPLGTMLSPAAGYGYPSGDPNIPTPIFSLPDQIVADASGNVWVSDFGSSKLVMFFGIATPTKMPVQPTPVAP